MPSNLLLLDTDAFVLLAGSGHLDRLLSLLEVPVDRCRRLSSLPFVFRKRIAKQLSQPVVARIEDMIGRVTDLELSADPVFAGHFQAVREIDVGEAVLYAVLAEHPSHLLTTNDKRSMRALCADPALADLRARIAGRVMAVESAVARLIAADGASSIARGFQDVASLDAVLRLVFTDANVNEPDGCARAIDSYLRDLIETTGQGFLYLL